MKFRYLVGLTPFLIMPTVASASDFGCEALLCFAGGKNVSECQNTIKKVIKDMAKGKSFPHCSFVGASSSINQNSAVGTRTYNEVSPRPVCRDGQTRGTRMGIGGMYTCRTIEINIDPQYAVDKEHQQQFFNY